MGQETLVDVQVQDGQRLLRQLSRDDFPVTAAAWIKTSDDGLWFYYVASPHVKKEGPVASYGLVRRSLEALPGLSFEMDDVKVLDERDPLAKGLRPILGGLEKMGPSANKKPARWGGQSIGTERVEDAYIYTKFSYTVDHGGGEMTDAELIRRTIELMSRSGALSTSSVTLKDGHTFAGVPIGVELVNDAMTIKFLVEPTQSPRIYPVSEISEIR